MEERVQESPERAPEETAVAPEVQDGRDEGAVVESSSATAGGAIEGETEEGADPTGAERDPWAGFDLPTKVGETDGDGTDTQVPNAEVVASDGFDEVADREALARAFPGVALDGMQSPERYRELRGMGLSAREAFLATNAALLTRSAERMGAARAAGKAHLQSVAKKAGVDSGSRMTNGERSFIREFFSDTMSDRDMEALWAKAR